MGGFGFCGNWVDDRSRYQAQVKKTWYSGWSHRAWWADWITSWIGFDPEGIADASQNLSGSIQKIAINFNDVVIHFSEKGRGILLSLFTVFCEIREACGIHCIRTCIRFSCFLSWICGFAKTPISLNTLPWKKLHVQLEEWMRSKKLNPLL